MSRHCIRIVAIVRAPKETRVVWVLSNSGVVHDAVTRSSATGEVSFNFGPDFAFPIDPEKDGLPKCRGLSPDLDPPKPPPEKIGERRSCGSVRGGEGATKPEEEKKERKQSTSRSEDERGSPRARSKDEACGVYEKQTKREENKENSVKEEEDVDAVMEEEKDEEKVNAASEKVEEKNEAPAEVKEGEVQEFGTLSDAIKPACFSRGGKDKPEHARGLDAYVEANTFPVQIKPEVSAKEDEDDVEAKEQSRADELVPTRDDMQHFYENGEPFDADEDGTNIAANNNDEDGTIGHNWLFRGKTDRGYTIRKRTFYILYRIKSYATSIPSFDSPLHLSPRSSSLFCFFFSFGSVKNCAYANCFASKSLLFFSLPTPPPFTFSIFLFIPGRLPTRSLRRTFFRAISFCRTFGRRILAARSMNRR